MLCLTSETAFCMVLLQSALVVEASDQHACTFSPTHHPPALRTPPAANFCLHARFPQHTPHSALRTPPVASGLLLPRCSWNEAGMAGGSTRLSIVEAGARLVGYIWQQDRYCCYRPAGKQDRESVMQGKDTLQRMCYNGLQQYW